MTNFVRKIDDYGELSQIPIPETMPFLSILFIDNETGQLASYVDGLREELEDLKWTFDASFAVYGLSDKEAWELLDDEVALQRFNVFCVDQDMPEGNGDEFCDELSARAPRCVRLLYTANQTNAQMARKAGKLGPIGSAAHFHKICPKLSGGLINYPEITSFMKKAFDYHRRENRAIRSLAELPLGDLEAKLVCLRDSGAAIDGSPFRLDDVFPEISGLGVQDAARIVQKFQGTRRLSRELSAVLNCHGLAMACHVREKRTSPLLHRGFIQSTDELQRICRDQIDDVHGRLSRLCDLSRLLSPESLAGMESVTQTVSDWLRNFDSLDEEGWNQAIDGCVKKATQSRKGTVQIQYRHIEEYLFLPLAETYGSEQLCAMCEVETDFDAFVCLCDGFRKDINGLIDVLLKDPSRVCKVFWGAWSISRRPERTVSGRWEDVGLICLGQEELLPKSCLKPQSLDPSNLSKVLHSSLSVAKLYGDFYVIGFDPVYLYDVQRNDFVDSDDALPFLVGEISSRVLGAVPSIKAVVLLAMSTWRDCDSRTFEYLPEDGRFVLKPEFKTKAT